MIGQIIGNIYQIVDKLGEGGMGSVYKGLDLNLQRPVAIKVLRPDLANNPALVERFHSEAITLAKLNHPNIATLYSFIPQDNQFFMIMEFVAGETLAKLIARGAINYKEAIPLFCQALEGIGQAHRAGIIHRDIKPANLMVMTEDFEKKVKVMDFGIARILGTNRLTNPGGLVGTLHYMSPEQIKGQDIDTRSDIYALGILLYEMLTGKLPFDANSEYALLDMHVKQPPPPLHLVKPDVPLLIEDAVLKAMAKSPNERFQTVVEFRNFLLNQPASLSNISSGIKETKLESIPSIQVTKIENIPILQETKIEETPIIGGTRVEENTSSTTRETHLQAKANTQQGINQLTNSDNPLHINSPAQINYQLALQNQNKPIPPTEIVNGTYPKPDNFLKQHLIKIVAGTAIILIVVVGLTAKFLIFPSTIISSSPSPSPTSIATVVTKLITTNPVEKEELLRVIKSNPTLQEQIVEEIAELQLNFEMTSEVEQEFLVAGANKKLIESMMKKSYFAPVPTPEPTATSVPTNNFPGGGNDPNPKVITPNPPDNLTNNNSMETTPKPKPSPKPLDIRPIPKPIDMAEKLQRKKALENRLKRLVDELSETSDPVKREQIRKEVQTTNSELNKLK